MIGLRLLEYHDHDADECSDTTLSLDADAKANLEKTFCSILWMSLG